MGFSASWHRSTSCLFLWSSLIFVNFSSLSLHSQFISCAFGSMWETINAVQDKRTLTKIFDILDKCKQMFLWFIYKTNLDQVFPLLITWKDKINLAVWLKSLQESQRVRTQAAEHQILTSKSCPLEDLRMLTLTSNFKELLCLLVTTLFFVFKGLPFSTWAMDALFVF